MEISEGVIRLAIILHKILSKIKEDEPEKLKNKLLITYHARVKR